ncbi:MAG: putative phosphoribosylaminoimidazole-succinocarboxamide synthase B [Candidatus Kapaibacterium sp.]|nr:MAG: putative phosphoribosylaminoimidazole-succinocarboxamide synthase B [Candidatus Kapabacteria bacterium]
MVYPATLSRCDLPLPLVHRGKVRDVFAVDDDRLLMVATDRVSAYDVVMAEPIPGKGIVLTQLSAFWFERTQHIVPNHLLSVQVREVLPALVGEHPELDGRTMLVRRTEPIRFECVVRGYLAGSAWREYSQRGTVSGIALAPGLRQSERLPEPLFTPATKADRGHDENITFEAMAERLGQELAEQLRCSSLELYHFAHEYALARGLILADTKFEFGTTPNGAVLLIDEILTPDSSRYWLAEGYEPGKPQVEFDKQILRDWLDRTDWDHTPPPPSLSPAIIEQTALRYHEAYIRLTGNHLAYFG